MKSFATTTWMGKAALKSGVGASTAMPAGFQSRYELTKKHEFIFSQFPLLTSSICCEYEVGLPHVFICRLSSLSSLSHERDWLCRDGFVPLLWFFHNFPVPGKFRRRLAIHYRWWRVIPEAWRAQTSLYSHESLVLPSKPERRWVTWILNAPAFCTMDHFQNEIDRIRNNRALEKLRRSAEVIACIEASNGTLAMEKAGNHSLRFSALLEKKFQGPFDVLMPNQIRNVRALDDAVILDLNEKLICSDDANLHWMLAKGARIYNQLPRLALRERRTVWFSNMHGIRLYSWRAGASSLWRDPRVRLLKSFFESTQDLVPGTRFAGYPWPFWVEEFAQKLLRDADGVIGVRRRGAP